MMRLKVYIPYGFKIIGVSSFDEVNKIATQYQRWEYIQ